MRRRLAWVFVALAVMLTVGFLVPLGLSVRSQAELRGLASAQSDARGVATALAAVAGTTGEVPGATEAEFILATYGADNLLILLPDGATVGTSPVDPGTLPLLNKISDTQIGHEVAKLAQRLLAAESALAPSAQPAGSTGAGA
mgnify:CR=1 FL=1